MASGSKLASETAAVVARVKFRGTVELEGTGPPEVDVLFVFPLAAARRRRQRTS